MNKFRLSLIALLAIFSLSCKSGNPSEKSNRDNAKNVVSENVNGSDNSVKSENTQNNTEKIMENKNDALVLISTDKGDITVRLFGDTPIHRDNFLKLAKEGFYDGLLFHRVIPGFMIQAGDPLSKNAQPGEMLGAGDPGYTLEAEIRPNHLHAPGVLAAARKGDMVNPERRSSGSQFYIVTGNASHLDGQYTVFGEVVDGMDAVRAIEKQPTSFDDRPLEDVHIISMKVLSDD